MTLLQRRLSSGRPLVFGSMVHAIFLDFWVRTFQFEQEGMHLHHHSQFVINDGSFPLYQRTFGHFITHNEICCHVWIVYRYRSILQLVKPWYDEVKDYSFPYPRDCNPRCPLKCYGPMCTHYTQVSRIWYLCVINFFRYTTVQKFEVSYICILVFMCMWVF